MTTPAHKAVDRDVATLSTFNLTVLATRLHEHIELDRRHPSEPDGFPTSTLGAATPTATSATNASTDLSADVSLTSVEAASEARRHHRDEHRRRTRDAIEHLADAARHLRAAEAVLDKLDEGRRNNTAPSTEPGCRALERIGAWEQIAHRVVIDGDVWPLGTWAYGFLTRNGRLPTNTECTQHAAGKRVMIKAG